MQDCRAIYSVHLPQRGKINLQFKNKKERAFLVHVDLKKKERIIWKEGGIFDFYFRPKYIPLRPGDMYKIG